MPFIRTTKTHGTNTYVGNAVPFGGNLNMADIIPKIPRAKTNVTNA